MDNTGQAFIDDAHDMRRLLRARGQEPGDTAPVCDFCNSWTATHVVGDHLVCDKPKCQDKAAPKVRPFETTPPGWVTCAVCGKQITEGWEEGRLGEQAFIHYCYEHTENQEGEVNA